MLIAILVWFALSLFAGLCGRKRAFGFMGFFIASLLFSPFVVLFVLILTTPTGSEEGTS